MRLPPPNCSPSEPSGCGFAPTALRLWVLVARSQVKAAQASAARRPLSRSQRVRCNSATPEYCPATGIASRRPWRLAKSYKCPSTFASRTVVRSVLREAECRRVGVAEGEWRWERHSDGNTGPFGTAFPPPFQRGSDWLPQQSAHPRCECVCCRGARTSFPARRVGVSLEGSRACRQSHPKKAG